MKRRQKAPEEGSDWMGTYGDMVTLLLCFFVLLYSISSVDQVKWENLVKSMNPEAAETSQIVTDTLAKEGTENVPGANTTEIDQKFDEMYDNLLKMQDASGEVADIQIAKGDGYQFITFKDNVFLTVTAMYSETKGRPCWILFLCHSACFRSNQRNPGTRAYISGGAEYTERSHDRQGIVGDTLGGCSSLCTGKKHH